MTVTINIPDDLYKQALAIANAQRLSVDELFASALAAQLAEWKRLNNRAAKGEREKFLAVLDKAPDLEPEDLIGFDRSEQT